MMTVSTRRLGTLPCYTTIPVLLVTLFCVRAVPFSPGPKHMMMMCQHVGPKKLSRTIAKLV